MRHAFIRLSLFLLCAGFALDAFATDLRMPLAKGGAIVLDAPRVWKVEEQSDATLRTWVLSPKKGMPFQVIVTPLVKSDGSVAGGTLVETKAYVERIAHEAAAQAVAEPVVLELKGATVLGYYFSAIDKAPKPGEYKFLTQGSYLVSDVPVAFTILSNYEPEVVSARALGILKGARREK